MKLKTKENLRFRGLCALLLLLSCCFRTAAVLTEDREKVTEQIYDSFLFSTEQTEEGPS